MPLLAPNSSATFDPAPRDLLEEFNVYDREETLGEELGRYDPNAPEDLERLLGKYFFPVWFEEYGYTIQHKWEFARAIAKALEAPDFDFTALFRDDYEKAAFCLPDRWKIADARLFYVRSYKLMVDRWGKEWSGLFPNLPDPGHGGKAS